MKRLIIGISLLVILLPVSIIGLSIFNSIRNKNNYEKNAFVQFSNFFVNQGSSVNMISLAIENKDNLDEEDHLYTFGPVLENFNSKINKFFKVDLIGDKHTSFAHDVSIIGLGVEGVNRGEGLGSQYLGELFMDYGYIGIILYSLILGVGLRILSEFYRYGFIGYSISLVLIQSVLFLPRSQSFQFINSIISVNYWLLIVFMLIIFIISKRCKKYV
jgi:oligosaccharide repeat unit polymerase